MDKKNPVREINYYFHGYGLDVTAIEEKGASQQNIIRLLAMAPDTERAFTEYVKQAVKEDGEQYNGLEALTPYDFYLHLLNYDDPDGVCGLLRIILDVLEELSGIRFNWTEDEFDAEYAYLAPMYGWEACVDDLAMTEEKLFGYYKKVYDCLMRGEKAEEKTSLADFAF